MSVHADGFTKVSSCIQDMVKKVVTTMAKVHTETTELPEIKNKKSCDDKEISKAAEDLNFSINTTMIHVRSFVQKINRLVAFICNEKNNAISAVNRRDTDSLQDYFKEIESKLGTCQRDIESLQKYVAENKENTTNLKDVVTKKKEKTHSKAQVATGAAVTGGVAAVGGIGAAVGGFLGAAGLVALFATPIAVVAIPVGAGVAAVGGVVAIAGGVRAAHQGNKEGQYDQALGCITDMEEKLIAIKKDLDRISVGLQLSIKNNCEEINEEKIRKLKRSNSVVQRSVKAAIETMAEQAKNVQEYTKPMADAATLDNFVIKMKNS